MDAVSFFRGLFGACNHHWCFVRNLEGEEYIQGGGMQSEWQCSKCYAYQHRPDEYRSSQEWMEYFRENIVDPDGWDRENFKESWSEKITYMEYHRRSLQSSHLATRDTEEE